MILKGIFVLYFLHSFTFFPYLPILVLIPSNIIKSIHKPRHISFPWSQVFDMKDCQFISSIFSCQFSLLSFPMQLKLFIASCLFCSITFYQILFPHPMAESSHSLPYPFQYNILSIIYHIFPSIFFYLYLPILFLIDFSTI